MEVVLARPRGFCAGVVRAIDIVNAALELYDAPVYVLHEIVHNQRVLADLRARGASFVESLDEVPREAVLILSAHGVSREIAAAAAARGFHTVIDATCPLVAKVHLEVARYAHEGREVVAIGHAEHPEMQGTLGQYDRSHGGAIYCIATLDDVAALAVREPERLAYVTQTTLSQDDTGRIIKALRARFPSIRGPRQEDICYATQNRQAAVRRLAERVDLLVVVGATNSSNSNRLREVGEASGVPSYLVQSAADLRAEWLSPGIRTGVTAGASAPEVLVQEVVSTLKGYEALEVRELEGEVETVEFRLPDPLAQWRRRSSPGSTKAFDASR